MGANFERYVRVISVVTEEKISPVHSKMEREGNSVVHRNVVMSIADIIA